MDIEKVSCGGGGEESTLGLEEMCMYTCVCVCVCVCVWCCVCVCVFVVSRLLCADEALLRLPPAPALLGLTRAGWLWL